MWAMYSSHNMELPTSAQKGPRVVVIGAGWSGLTAAKAYFQIDPSINLTILESESTLGGTWSASRIYPELTTQQPYGQYEAVDFPLEKRDPDLPGNFIPSKRIHDYMEEYAAHWNIADKIRYNITVLRVRRASDDITWEVHITGEDIPLICDKLIVATGFTSQPNLPDIPSSNFKPLTFHSRYLGENYDALKSSTVHTVTVYGGGKSAYDAVNTAMRADKKVQWVVRASGQGMSPMVDIEIIRKTPNATWAPVMSALWPDPLNLGWSYRFFHSGRNSFGSWLIWKFWSFMTDKNFRTLNYDGNENLKKLKPNHLDNSGYWAVPTPFPIPDMDVVNAVRKGDSIKIHRADITNLVDKTIHLSDGTSLETDVLIHATSYAYHDSVFSEEDAYKLGLSVPCSRFQELGGDPNTYSKRDEDLEQEIIRRFPRLAEFPHKSSPKTHTEPRLYRHVLPLPFVEKQDRSLAFVGFFHGLAYATVCDITGLWAAAWLSNQMDFNRDMKDIEWEVDYLNAYERKRYGNRGSKTPVVLESLSMNNAMLQDLGLPPPNLSQFTPWLPRVYGPLAERWKEMRANKSKSGGKDNLPRGN